MLDNLKKIYIGNDDFKKLRTNKNAYYIDKSLFIKDVIDNCSEVCLITRPRRFGKTLNMSMLYYFFSNNQNCLDLFNDLKIMKCGSEYLEYLNNVPVIFLSFNGLISNSFNDMIDNYCNIISNLYSEFRFLLESDIIYPDEKSKIISYLNGDASVSDLRFALLNLTKYLYNYYNKKVFILIDEYDVPIIKCYGKKYYEDVLSFFKSVFSSCFKGNCYLEKAILTGVSRITKEGIFTGANNFDVYTILDSREFSNDFGFTKEEVIETLKYYNLYDKYVDVSSWYDGYKIGNISNIYNPWSVIKFLQEKQFKPYWINTSDNDIINWIVQKNSYISVKEKLLDLVNGKEIMVYIDDEVSINSITDNIDNIWSLFLCSGYLSIVNCVSFNDRLYTVKIPNNEILFLFNDIIKKWFNRDFKSIEFDILINSLINVDMNNFNYLFKNMIREMFSYFDVVNDYKKTAESFYHAFVLGMLVSLRDRYYIHSNRESGYGRYDIELEPKNVNDNAFILEFKLYDDKITSRKVIKKAREQIINNMYVSNLKERGISNIYRIVFAFNGKDVVVKIV